jgi:hypothetical protein
VTTGGLNGADVIAVGAIHGWSTPPDATPTYTNGFAHLTSTPAAGTGSALVAQYVGELVTNNAGPSGSTIITQTATMDNTAGFLIAYTRTPPPVIVPITAVNSSTGWTLTGETSTLAALTDANDISTLTTGDLNGGTASIDVQLGSMEKPPSTFVVRVRVKRDAATASVSGQLYDGATLLSTSDSKSPPQGVYGDTLLTFPAVDIAATSAARWIAGLRLVVTGTAT